jgi:CRISPR/Cas system CMR-associated protein Cmr5 small subunit
LPSPTTYQRFEKSYNHAFSLLPKSKNFSSNSNEADLSRYAVILGVASMDAYFTKKFVEKLASFIKRNGLNIELIALLRKAKVDENTYLSLLDKKRPFRVITSNVQKHLEGMTTQKFYRIDELFENYNVHDLCDRSIQHSIQYFHNIKHTTYKMRINWLVDRRNVIAHTCDLNYHNRFDEINSVQVRNYLKTLKYFVEGAENVLNSTLK